jgi:hypothetical protein
MRYPDRRFSRKHQQFRTPHRLRTYLESTCVLIDLDVFRGDNLLCINARAALTYLSMADVFRPGCRPEWPPWGE